MKTLKYAFQIIDHCNMCGAASSAFRVLGKRLNQSQGRSPKGKAGISTTVVQCRVCGLIFSNPQPVPESIQQHYGTPPEEYWTEEYFKVRDEYFTGEIQWLKKLMDFRPGIRTLDIGAGIGKCMLALEKAGCESYGFEPSEPFYKRAIERMQISPDRLKLFSIEEASYPEGFFDFITFGAVLEHLYDPSAAIIKALSWLKRGGLIHIEVPSARWLVSRLINTYYRLSGSDYVGNISPMHPPFHLYEFTIRSFEAHAARNGYQIADHGYYVCETYLPKVIDPILKPIMEYTNTGMQLAVWLRSPS